MEKITGFKGFDKDLCCLGFQYEIGKEYHIDGKIICCTAGFHFYTDPRDVFKYYTPGKNNRFCIVEGSGTSDTDSNDSKIAVSDIKIIKELSLNELHIAIRKYIKEHEQDKTEAEKASSSGDYSSASSSGNKSSASSSGDYSSASSSGYASGALAVGTQAKASVNSQCVGVVVGYGTRARGAVGSWLVLSEAHFNKEHATIIDCVRCAKIDGKNLLANTWYTLKNGHFVEVDEG